MSTLVQFFIIVYSEYLPVFPSIKPSSLFIQNLPQAHPPWLSRARPPNLYEIENASSFLVNSKKLNLCWLIFFSSHLKITNGKERCAFQLVYVMVTSWGGRDCIFSMNARIVAAWILNWWIFPVNRFSSKRLLHHTIDWLNFMNNVHTNEVHVC